MGSIFDERKMTIKPPSEMPKLCQSCHRTKPKAKVTRNDKVLWLCKACVFEKKQHFDQFGTLRGAMGKKARSATSSPQLRPKKGDSNGASAAQPRGVSETFADAFKDVDGSADATKGGLSNSDKAVGKGGAGGAKEVLAATGGDLLDKRRAQSVSAVSSVHTVSLDGNRGSTSSTGPAPTKLSAVAEKPTASESEQPPATEAGTTKTASSGRPEGPTTTSSPRAVGSSATLPLKSSVTGGLLGDEMITMVDDDGKAISEPTKAAVLAPDKLLWPVQEGEGEKPKQQGEEKKESPPPAPAAAGSSDEQEKPEGTAGPSDKQEKPEVMSAEKPVVDDETAPPPPPPADDDEDKTAKPAAASKPPEEPSSKKPESEQPVPTESEKKAPPPAAAPVESEKKASPPAAAAAPAKSPAAAAAATAVETVAPLPAKSASPGFKPKDPKRLSAPRPGLKKKKKRGLKPSELAILKETGTEQTDPLQAITLGRRLGSGATGSVWAGVYKAGGDVEVAVKVMDCAKPTDLKDLVSEIRIMRGCEYAHVVNYLNSYFYQEQLWVVLELCHRGTLTKLIERTFAVPSTFTEAEMACVAKGMCLGLQFLHSKDLIHRDIKPENVLFTQEGIVKLSDFGVSRQMASRAAKAATLVGTPHYMAPELVTSGDDGYTNKVDMWGLGLCLIEMRDGKSLFSGVNPMQVLFKLGDPNLKIPGPVNDQIQYSDSFTSFLDACCSVSPDSRLSAEDALKNSFLAPESVRPQVIFSIDAK